MFPPHDASAPATFKVRSTGDRSATMLKLLQCKGTPRMSYVLSSGRGIFLGSIGCYLSMEGYSSPVVGGPFHQFSSITSASSAYHHPIPPRLLIANHRCVSAIKVGLIPRSCFTTSTQLTETRKASLSPLAQNQGVPLMQLYYIYIYSREAPTSASASNHHVLIHTPLSRSPPCEHPHTLPLTH